jgi:hypothetical protein
MSTNTLLGLVSSPSHHRNVSWGVEKTTMCYRGELEKFLQIVWVLGFVPDNKPSRVSCTGTYNLSIKKSNLKTYSLEDVVCEKTCFGVYEKTSFETPCQIGLFYVRLVFQKTSPYLLQLA